MTKIQHTQFVHKYLIWIINDLFFEFTTYKENLEILGDFLGVTPILSR